MKEGLKHLYCKITEKFEGTVNDLNQKADTLDLTLKSAKDDLEKIQLKSDMTSFNFSIKCSKRLNTFFTKDFNQVLLTFQHFFSRKFNLLLKF